MQWREAVLASLKAYCQRRTTRVIQRQTFIAEEIDSIVAMTNSIGATPQYTLSKSMQELRDEGIVEFLSRGEYLLLDGAIDVEDEDLTDEAIDYALRANRLKIGVITTDSQQALVRRRKGQARVRQLTLENYSSCCAVCDITDLQLLVASHIIGWAEAPEYRGNLDNVICMCRLHDALFETGYWSLDDDLNLLKQASVTSNTIRIVLEAMTSFRLPLAYTPALNFIRGHRKRSGINS